jgi:hypothetical protein
MKARAGLLGRPLAGWILGLTLLWITVPGVESMAAEAMEANADSTTSAVQFIYCPKVKVPSLRRLCFPPVRPTTQIALAYSHPLVMELIFGPQHMGPSGNIFLPGNRQLRSELDFGVII